MSSLHLALVASNDSSKSDNDGGNLFSIASEGVVVSFLLFIASEYDVFVKNLYIINKIVIHIIFYIYILINKIIILK